MNKTTMMLLTPFLLAAAILFTAPATAQKKDDDKAKPEKKYVVRVLTIENGDTTVTDHPINADDSEFTWVDDDGTKLKAVFEDDDGDMDDSDMMEDMTIEVLGKKKYNEFILQSGKDGSRKHVFMKKMGGDDDRDCCRRESCCSMDMKGMHGDMDRKEMMRMHEKMKKMMLKEKKEDNDKDEDDSDKDDDDDNLL